MRPRFWSLFLLLPAILAVALSPQSEAAAPAQNPIRHIVVIYMENHSFNNVLGKLCVDDQRCEGTTTGQLSDGTTIPLTEATDVVPAIGHGTAATTNAINGGAMNGFDTVLHCHQSDGYPCFTQYSPEEIPNLAALARSFVIADHTFNSDVYSSWVSHIALVSSTKDGFFGNIPQLSQDPNVTKGPGWGCDSNMDARWAPPDSQNFILVPACIPDQTGFGPYRPSPVQWVPTIMDRMDAAGLSWRLDSGEGTEDKSVGTGYAWSTCPSFADCLYTQQVTKVRPWDAIINQANIGRLPRLAIVTPTFKDSQHNNTSMLRGDNWIGSIVQAIMNGSQWNSTAIFISYDDCGCFYDEVSSPPGLGIRTPMVIVSPYARAGFTDTSVASTSSMLAFIEHTYHLSPLGAGDQNAYDFAQSFDFTQPPAPPISLTHTALPRSERRWLSQQPIHEGET
ncbi:MAG: alkaline phosphatase family protein [Actinomycetota bacterium]